MTYQSTITTDAPYVYWRLDESTGTTAANLGSLGGSGAIGASVTKGQTPAGTIDGNAMFFNGGATTAYAVTQTVSVGATWTVEFWVKNGGWSTSTYNTLAYWDLSNGTSYFFVAIMGGTGQLRFRDSGGLDNTSISVPALVDGGWHHVAITRSGTTQTVYVDGVSKGTFTGTIATRASASMWIGAGRFQSSAAAYMDEYAFYNTALSGTQVQSHYTAGSAAPSTPVTVTAPVMGMSATAPAPVVTAQIVIPDVTNAVPAAAMSLTAPAPVVVAAKTASASVTGTMTLSLNSVTPTKVTALTSYVAIADRSSNGGLGSASSISMSSGGLIAKFADLTDLPAGKSIGTASFSVYTSTSAGLTVQMITDAWDENGTSHPAISSEFFVIGGSTGSAGYKTVDVTNIVNRWTAGLSPNYGLYVYINGGVGEASTRESSNPPRLSLTLIERFDSTNAAPVATLELSAVNADASTTYGVTNSVPAITSGLEFIGGVARNPDSFVVAPALVAGLTAPNARQFIEYNSIVDAPAINVGNVETSPVTISLTTGRRVVVPAMTMSLKWPGIYVEAADRYTTLLKNNLRGELDVWYRLGGEANGATRIKDSSFTNFENQYNYAYDGYVFGNPDFNITDGPELRRAARFDGVDDYIVAGPYARFGNYNEAFQNIKYGEHAVTVEFSIRTTQLNGTIFNATGGGNGAAASMSPTAFARPTIDQFLNLKNGYLHVVDDTGIPTKTLARSGFISDGEWHHIVMSVPKTSAPTNGANSEGFWDNYDASYLMVDGKVVIARYGLVGGEGWAPYAFMANAKFVEGPGIGSPGGSGTNGPTPGLDRSATGYIAGDLADIVVRLQTYVKPVVSENAYYEWSDSTLVKPEVMTLNIGTVAPFKARGNSKRLLAVYGMRIDHEGNTGMFTGGEPISAYQSKFSGFCIQSFEQGKALQEADRTGWHRVGAMGNFEWQIPAVFQAGDFTVYPVSIIGGGTDSMRGDIYGVPSAEGLLNPDSESDTNGRFADYETGLPRFINLQEDLAEPIENFDALTVVNYPWIKPNGKSVENQEFGLNQASYGLSDSEWGVARDNLRDSILEAVYNGLSLWIGEWHMAQHLGFIKDVDFHRTGNFWKYGNYGAQAVDRAHDNTEPDKIKLNIENGLNGYYSYPQVNTYRRIVAEVPGLTDLPTNEYGEVIEGWDSNQWKPHGSFLAWDIVKRPNGLQVGDKVYLDIIFKRDSEWWGQTEGSELTSFAPSKRTQIVSARPDGIIGRVVSREMDSYYGEGLAAVGNRAVPVVIDNPYKNNAYTIAVERGSVVRGRPTRGRVFIELMDLGASVGGIMEDKDKKRRNGDRTDTQESAWDFDTRRDKEIKLENITTALTLPTDSTVGGGNTFTVKNTITNYFSYENGEKVIWKTLSMHMRGLHWLSEAPDVNGDDYIAYAPPITVDLKVPAPVFSRTRNPVSEVTGTMRLDLEVRQPANYKDGSVMERTLPIELSLEMRGIGMTATAPAMVATLSMAAPVVDAETETIILYMDNTDTVTLFIKEED